MNVYRITKIRTFYTLLKFKNSYSSAAQAANEIEALHKQEPKTTKNITGINVASVENYSPITNISVLVKAGSRYEDGHNLGLVHCLRNCASLSTKNHTAFAITRNLELYGAKLSITSTREYLLYNLHCVRDNFDSAIEFLADIVTQPAFKPWEITDSLPRMQLDLALYKQNQDAVLMETLHQVAFRGGLNNSLYCHPFNIGKHTSEMLHSFVKKNFIVSRTSIVGLGISHDHLENTVTKLFSLENNNTGNDLASKFGGGEIRVEADDNWTRVAIVAEGAGWNNPKEMLSLGVLQCLMGTGNNTKHNGTKHSKLGEAAIKCTNKPFTVSSLNLNYSDIGIFGVYLAGNPNDMNKLVKSVVSQMRSMTKNISEESVEAAKHALKTKLHLERKTLKDTLLTKAIEVTNVGHIRNIKEVEKAIDELKSSDISAIASKIMKTKPAMAAIGPLHSTPHLDELL